MTRNNRGQDEEEAALLAAAGFQGTLPRNDPDWQSDLEEMKRQVDELANATASVHIVEGRDPHLQVRTHNARNRPQLTRTGIALGALLEAPVVRVEDKRPGHAHADHGYHQPAKHRHYRDDSK